VVDGSIARPFEEPTTHSGRRVVEAELDLTDQPFEWKPMHLTDPRAVFFRCPACGCVCIEIDRELHRDFHAKVG
jgi:hypothetical protein